MADGPASFWTQANALLRKNLAFQKRNIRSNVRLIVFPFLLSVLLVVIQNLVNKQLAKPSNRCGCACIDTNGDGKCEKVCGIQYSTVQQVGSCLIPSPPEWPPLLQVPAPEFRAVQTNFILYADLPNESCRRTGSCPAAILLTGNNRTLGLSLAANIFPSSSISNASDMLYSVANDVLGSASKPQVSDFLEPAFVSNLPVYYLQPQCASSSTFPVSFSIGSALSELEANCVRGFTLWRNSSSEINDELYKGYRKGNPQQKINEIVAGYDFSNTDTTNFNVSIWYNSTYKNDTGTTPFALTRVPRSINLVSNAYLQFLLGPGTRMLFEFVKEMPKPETLLRMDFSSLLGPLFFTWIIIQLFPVMLSSLVYEKQQRLRIMMKMHGLGDGPYWMISYAYFLLLSSVYTLVFVMFGSVIGLKFFTLNDYSIQFAFYFLYINLQVSLAFLVAALFSNVKMATGCIMVFGTGLLGGFLFQFFNQASSFSRGWIIVMELYPGFSLYRGLYEFAQYAFEGDYMGTVGMRWKNLSDRRNGMKEVLIILSIEWDKVEQLLLESRASHAIVSHNLKKVYPGRDGNPEKFVVRGVSLALPRAECFGMLGPSGAGKTSFISMMIGLPKPSSGTAYVQGLDIRSHMDSIYTSMGVCPQHDLLWESLTGREHLLFYGRLKNLKGAALTQAVEESLKSVNLFHRGVADKQAGKYSGGYEEEA
ncbi:hypothetical protein ACH5RR_007672 [Cinchona calisaya]|uniref:ABC transporter domain-containing protein n=1 Tax=Cinchona calisaya TaxID=153742 RepID=A0ABD3A973_9GENT